MFDEDGVEQNVMKWIEMEIEHCTDSTVLNRTVTAQAIQSNLIQFNSVHIHNQDPALHRDPTPRKLQLQFQTPGFDSRLQCSSSCSRKRSNHPSRLVRACVGEQRLEKRRLQQRRKR